MEEFSSPSWNSDSHSSYKSGHSRLLLTATDAVLAITREGLHLLSMVVSTYICKSTHPLGYAFSTQVPIRPTPSQENHQDGLL